MTSLVAGTDEPEREYTCPTCHRARLVPHEDHLSVVTALVAEREALREGLLSDDTIERAAQCLYDTDDERPRRRGVAWENEPDGYRGLYRDKAREVLAAVTATGTGGGV